MFQRSSSTYKGDCKFVSDMIEQTKKLANPKDVHICTGSQQEAEMLIEVGD